MTGRTHFTAADGRKPLVLSSRLSAAAAFCRYAAQLLVGTQPKAHLLVFKVGQKFLTRSTFG
ncbi:hypothetical protein ACN4EK_04805 [Pantanalinema rosaneae CENA516]|uniref:hypothetical protein n=1 Tax=Pantanalinema rosaneae TaxID=1620701 RepID=UPI003D6F16C5